jgi:hypothetical protein
MSPSFAFLRPPRDVSASPSSFSLAAYTAAPDRLSVQSVHSQSTRKLLVGESLADRLVGQRANASHRVDFAISLAAQAEREFIDIALHVLDGEVVINAVVTTLQDCPDAFDAVGVRHAVNVLLGAVVDRAVIVAIDARVGRMRVGAEHRIIFYIRDYGVLNRAGLGIREDNGLYVATTFAHAKHSGLPSAASASMEFLALVLVLFLAAKIRLVGFNDARQQAATIRAIAARLADALKHEPRRLLRDAEFLADLHGRNALARRRYQVHGVQPFIQGDVRALENRARADGEVLLAREAAEVADHRSPFGPGRARFHCSADTAAHPSSDALQGTSAPPFRQETA